MENHRSVFSNVIGDIVEKPPKQLVEVKRSVQRHARGFPAVSRTLPKRESKSMSAYKEKMLRKNKESPGLEGKGNLDDQGIDEENRVRLERMNDLEIEGAQEEIRATIRDDLLEMLKKRAFKKKAERELAQRKDRSSQVNTPDLSQRPSDDSFLSNEKLRSSEKLNRNLQSVLSSEAVDSSSGSPSPPMALSQAEIRSRQTKRVMFPDKAEELTKIFSLPTLAPIKGNEEDDASEDAKHSPKKHSPALSDGTTSNDGAPLEFDTTHLPEKQVTLDPNDPSFYEQLHDKYFPNLPVDEKQMQWLHDPSPAENSYHPSVESLHAHEIRFGFKGEIITPSQSQTIPVNEGLHHHGDAPFSAGYTLVELAHLLRSSFPTQRCIAIQTIGRIIYRLNSGEFREVLSPELHTLVEDAHIYELLAAAASDQVKHLTVRSLAIEALWLCSQSQHGSSRSAV
ncbi:RNA polymerase II-associated protein rba50 [Schizosaccharomyces pombe]|uniref:RNA polymerase II-associated protein rba50 n=1 Tax=Schizosaccharomyces pombe (strain 972 / ATCC 24843) TaxID=284812 RepID=RBA50_SCHPO|nr:putative RNA polymerase II-associated protein [Schizosaccharomyces pombe]O43088.1 RecName: Full=RNA polymerase II-associated protein rba50 [Schizosaccharomyces pombe 972h-]CAA17041.1 RNA polymerase II associated protein (predicted) [Schizosaccharomyces pombe]|eukprot:NP_595263.1 putative RNA polymerase II-associated protein [Schizosaccharomyces pombe]